jgi:glycosyltransferase involved in cell wall biosynthesis
VTTLTYALVTPAHNELEHLPRLVQAVAAQSVEPEVLLVVDDGSTDGMRSVAERLARELPWLRVMDAPLDTRPAWSELPSGRRAGRDVIAFEAGVEALAALPDIVVKLDADVAFAPDFFERLLLEFQRDGKLGIASGICLELQNGVWHERHVTAGHVWGATRAYRRECLAAVFPLELRLGWDGIDLLRAELAGWTTRTLCELPFRHYRPEGAREGSSFRAWLAQGWSAWYMGYRPSYLVVRTLHHLRHDPSAVALLVGYLNSALRREERYSDADVRAILRRKQRLRELPRRGREVTGTGVGAEMQPRSI